MIPNTPMPDWERSSQIPIIECNDALQPTSMAPPVLSTYPAYYKMGVPDAVPECYLRIGVYRRLLAAANALPVGI